ncbi:hypothetical protein [Duganella sp. Root1480D1]|uniref:hypothetical protein n=1 Tax=Duganella sp. Root1480D1 TaxID=1736471 RepID=UPI00070C86F7|nr:hypothetical protein [Duganella sp. Root1480D1]KQZ39901.1 hypothetical protein ASD58_05840 [Duganella sp. Root1480D1]
MNRIELHDLTQEMITGGRKLLQQLDLEGLRPDSMYWEYDEECREWLLQVVIKHMDVEDNFKILRRVFSALDALPEVKELLRPDYFDVRGTQDPGYKQSRQRMPHGRGAGDHEWANRDFYCYRLS